MGISVLTLAKARHAHLDALIEGLRRSAVPPAELIIVDMNERRLDPPATPFPTRLLPLATAGLPLARARNLAAAAAQGEHLLFLDVDCIPMRGLVGAMAQALAQRDALICAEIRYLAATMPDPGCESALLAAARPHPARRFPHAGLRPASDPGLFWSLAFGVRRARFAALGGFDEAFTGYGAEDTDFAFHADRAGTGILFAGGPGAFHQHHSACDPPLQHFHDILRNAVLFHRKWQFWPMRGWLDAFAAIGLITLQADALHHRRDPTPAEIHAARRRPGAAF